MCQLFRCQETKEECFLIALCLLIGFLLIVYPNHDDVMTFSNEQSDSLFHNGQKNYGMESNQKHNNSLSAEKYKMF